MGRDWIGAPAARAEIEAGLLDARRRTLDLVRDLDGDRLLGPRLAIVNPVLWEIGHIAWFQEFWTLRTLRGEPPLRDDGDRLYDSARVAHDTRWDLSLPSRDATLRYMSEVLERAVAGLGDCERPEVAYYYRLALGHEDMHDEALTYTRQTLAYAAPALSGTASGAAPAAALPGAAAARSSASSTPPSATAFVALPGGTVRIGADPEAAFVFDNEKWVHTAELAPFRMARTAVTNGEFVSFVEDGGYARREFWSVAGWEWCGAARAEHPVYWRRGPDGWQERHFDRWDPLSLESALVHVCWYEAEAYCRWAGVRLPSEVEWEAAATSFGYAAGRLHPWGDASPSPERANLEGMRLGPIAAQALPSGDTPSGLRQLWGNVWEWTSTPFAPYPGFTADPYREYSEPWFDGRHRVLRGGCWATRARLLRNTYRNFYPCDRRDVFAGFRVCKD